MTFQIPPPPEFLNEEVKDCYSRMAPQVDETCVYRTSTTLSVLDVLHAHLLVADFSLSEGLKLVGLGPRSMNQVHSAVHRQHIGIGVRPKWKDRFDLCATLMYGLAMDHAFHDANKRTSFLSCLYHLGRVGRVPTASHQEFEDFLVEIADHQLDNYVRYKELRRQGKPDPEVSMISRWLRSKTRDVDNRQYTITYRELERILNSKGFDLVDPYKNTINVVQYETRRRFFRPPRTETKRIMQISFPGWSTQVSKGTLKDVRARTNLSHDHGIDSEVFFRGADDMNSLIAHYQDPLRRLADR
jgi:death-on-curing protein